MSSVYHLLMRQIPAHVRDNHPVFCKFIEYYYRWLQTKGFVRLDQCYNIDSNSRAITIKNGTLPSLKDYVGFTLTDDNGTLAEVIGYDGSKLIIRYITQDQTFSNNSTIYVKNTSSKASTDTFADSATITSIETLPSAFIEHFSKLLDSDQIFSTETSNIATILRNIKNLYQAKGSETALKYLIKVTKNVDVEIRYPWESVLKFDDGRWEKQYCVTVQADPKHWHSFPIQINQVRLMLDYELDNGDIAYKEAYIDKVEIFAQQSENYDTDDQWWIRYPIATYEKDPETGALLFPTEDDTYGIWGDRYVTPFIRFYFNSDPDVTVGQEVRIIGTHEDTEQQYVQWYGTVVNGIKSLNIVNKGKGWQVGQIFTASKDDIWYTYESPDVNHKLPSIAAINSLGITVDYSQDKPLIGRVTAVDSKGGMTSCEILQYGDHIPQYADKDITVSPLFFNDGTIDETPYLTTISINYAPVSSGTGYFQDMSGWLSCDSIKIHDSDYYQQFSYDIVSDVDCSVYQDMANLLHPVGTKMFTTYMIDSDLDAKSEFDVDINTSLISISLFDVAVATEELHKYITKNLTDSVTLEDQLSKFFTKNLTTCCYIVDSERKDNIVHNSLDINYDTPTEKTRWVEKIVDSDKKAKTSYVDSGTLNVLHINYSHNVTSDYLKYEQEPVQAGGYCIIAEDDGITLTERPAVQEFISEGTFVTIKFKLSNTTRYELKQAYVLDSNSNPVDCNKMFGIGSIYTIELYMPNDDVYITFDTEPHLYNIKIPEIEHGLITANKTRTYYQDVVELTPEPDDQYTLSSLYYYGEKTGEINIFYTKKFSMPQEDVTIRASFTRNGGSIIVTSCVGGEISFNVPNLDYVQQGTKVKLTIDVDRYHNLTNVMYQYFVNGETYQSYISDLEFDMPPYDVYIVASFETKRTTVTTEINRVQSARGSITVLPASVGNLIDVGTTITVNASPDYHSDLISLTMNGQVVSNPCITIVDLTNLHFIATFDHAGGEVGYYPLEDTFDGQYGQVNLSVDYDTYVKYNTTLTLTAPVKEGYTFKQFGIYKDIEGEEGEEGEEEEDDEEEDSYELIKMVTSQTSTYSMPRYDIYISSAEYTLNSHTLTVKSDTGGTLTASKTGTINYGTDITVTANPVDLYQLAKIVLTYNNTTTDITESKAFSMPDYDATVTPTWTKIQSYMYLNTFNTIDGKTDTVTGTYTVNGVSNPAAATSVINIGDTLTFDLYSSQPTKYYTKSLKYTTDANPSTSTGNWIIINGSLTMPSSNITVWVDVARIVNKYTLKKECTISESLSSDVQTKIQTTIDNLTIPMTNVNSDGTINSEVSVVFDDLADTGVTINNKKLVIDYDQIYYTTSLSSSVVVVPDKQFTMPNAQVYITVELNYHFE